MWLSLERPLLGTWTATQACALTGNWTSDPLVHSLVLNSLSHTSQGSLLIFKACQFMTKIAKLRWALYSSISNSEASLLNFRKHCYDFTSPHHKLFPDPGCFCHYQGALPTPGCRVSWPLPVSPVWAFWGWAFVHQNLSWCWLLGAAQKCSPTGLRTKKWRKCFFTIKSVSIFVKTRHRSLLKCNGLRQMSFDCQTITPTCLILVHRNTKDLHLSPTVLSTHEFGREKRPKVNQGIVKSLERTNCCQLR